MKEKVKEHRQLIRIVGGNNESIYYIGVVTLNQQLLQEMTNLEPVKHSLAASVSEITTIHGNEYLTAENAHLY